MADTHPLQILITSLAGWMNRHRGEVLDYLIEEMDIWGGRSNSTSITITESGTTRGLGPS